MSEISSKDPMPITSFESSQSTTPSLPSTAAAPIEPVASSSSTVSPSSSKSIGSADISGPRLLDYKPKPGQACPQTSPITVPLETMYPKKRYPMGQIMKYADELTTHRSSDGGKIRLEIQNDSVINDFRRAAEIHRQLRAYAREILKPGIKLYDFVTEIEMKGRYLAGECFTTEYNPLHVCSASSVAALAAAASIAASGGGKKGKRREPAISSSSLSGEWPYTFPEPDYTHAKAGLAFPTGVSLNNCAAHYTPNPGDDRVLLASDLIKVDIGTHVNGHIVDSAFSLSFVPVHETLIKASREATWAGLRAAGVDARLCDVGEAIEETMTSFEVEVGGKTRKVRSVKNLSGHQVGDYLVHAGMSVPIVKNGCDAHLKMSEGESYAIETFGSTGKGSVSDAPDCSHYMIEPDMISHAGAIRRPTARRLFNHIHQRFRTLAWCRRWLAETGEKQHALDLKALKEGGYINDYPPLVDQVGSFVSQHEHTVLLKPTAKEIVSFGDDD